MKITIVGAGNVGATTAKAIADRQLANEIVLIDIVEGVPQGKALDIAESSPSAGFDTNVIGTNNYADTAGSDIVVITAGVARKPGMTRDDLLSINASIVGGVVKEVAARSPDSIIVCVTNPLDVMTYLAYKVSGFPKNRVIGMAGVLDTSRFRLFIARELNVSVRDVNAFVLGGHGDSMVPCVDFTTVAGVPLRQMMSQAKIDELVKRAQNGGGEIVNLLKTGSAFYAPAASVTEMVEAIVKDTNRILPCAAYCDGDYGIKGVYCGVPVKLGAGGIKEIVKVNLTGAESAALVKSGEEVLGQIKALESLDAYKKLGVVEQGQTANVNA